MISFKPLQITLIKKDIARTNFITMMGISSSTAAKMWKNEYVALKIIDDICKKLGCEITDVIEYVPDEK